VRTTVTLDPDVEEILRRDMREKGLTFKQAINDAVRAGSAAGPPRRRRPLPTYDLGEPLVDITKALRLAGELENQEGAARLTRGG
jgi:hypothetical protein